MIDTATFTFDLTPPTEAQLHELEADLDEQERHVLLEHGTEAPFCGLFLDEKREGVYTCRLCGLPLFSGGRKFESGTGAGYAACRCSAEAGSLKAALAGRASPRPFRPTT